MVSAYEVIYPAGGVVILDGGINSKYEKSIIQDNESSDCLNIDLNNGVAATRAGSTKVNTTSIGTFTCDGIYTRREDTGAETMIAFHGGSARYLATTTFITIPSAQSVFTAGIRVAGTQYQNNLFVGNGGAIPYKYNGTDFTRHGVYPPTNTATFTSVSVSGTMSSGDKSYKFTYLNSYLAESDVSTAVTITGLSASAVVSITCIPIAPQSWGVSARRIYRSSGSTYVLIGTINDNTTTIFTDGAGIVPTSNAPTDNGVPPNYSVCLYHQNRLFVNDAANPNYIWYSELDEPFTFPSSNFIKVGDAASDLVKGLEIFDNTIVILCENSQWLNYMPSTDPSTWQQIRVRSNYGSKSPFGSFKFNNMVAFAATQNSKLSGYAAISGNAIDPSATFLTISAAGSDLLTDRLEPDMFQIQDAYIGNISAMVFKNRAYISVTYNSLSSQNDRVYVFDFSIRDLAKKNKFSWVPLTGINASQFTVYGGNLYYGSSTTDGFVYQLEANQFSDNGTAIDSYVWTKEFSGRPGHENLIKDFRKVKILVDLAGAYFMNLTWKVDSDKGEGQSKQIDLDPGGSIWGNTMVWGRDLWGGGKNQDEIEIPLGQTHGKRIQFKFDNQNTVNQRFKVHRLTFTYNIRGTT